MSDLRFMTRKIFTTRIQDSRTLYRSEVDTHVRDNEIACQNSRLP